MGQAHAVPRDADGRLFRFERKNLEDTTARDANPANLAARRGPFDAEEGSNPFGRCIRDTDERTPEHLPVELHRPVEIRHRDSDVAERANFHNAFSLCDAPARSSVSAM